MRRSILYKEFLKTKWALVGIVAVFAVYLAYLFLNISKSAEINGLASIWSYMIVKDSAIFENFKLFPLIAGILLSATQFIPEASHKRLKLTLHLPYPQGRMIALMYCYGILALCVIFALTALAIALFMSGLVAKELVIRIILTSLVWFICGIAGYLWTTAICLEPTWKMRILLLVLLAGVVGVCFLSPIAESYNKFLPWLAIFVLMGQFLIFYSVSRFKEGLQD